MGPNPDLPPALNIIGAGRVGKTLGRLWQDNRIFTINSILNRSQESGEKAVRFINGGQIASSFSDLKPAAFHMITVKDNQIADCALKLAESGKVRAGDIVFHCSGALSANLLEPVSAQGALTASFHPLNSFAEPDAALKTFRGTYCVLEGDLEAVSTLAKAANVIGGRTASIQSDKKIFYHASAVFACNYVTTLIEAALRSAEVAGISRKQAKEMLAPLIEETIRNNLEKSPAEALTGPIARRDFSLVEQQYQALVNWNKGVGNLYNCLAKATQDLITDKTG